jgi:ABC-type transport system involved in cytochrome c biogenesis permease subunit
MAYIPFQIFFPAAFFASTPPQVAGGFWFPGGWLIGLAMFANLLAAHTVRFTTPVRGMRLLIGGLVILLGIGVTGLVVASGSGAAGLQATPLLSWQVLWRLFQVHVVLAAIINIGVAVWLWRSGFDRRMVWMAFALTPITVSLAAWALVVPSVGDSSMRILWQLIKGTMAAWVLLAGCWIAFRKRAGIVVLHAGVGMLMVSELLVGLLAVETRMGLAEGETKDWAYDIRTVELAVVDPSNPDHDVLTRIPASRLKAGEVIANESFPFDIHIDKYFPNSSAVDASSGIENPATTGSGLAFVAQPASEVAGASTSGEVDQPALYATVTSKDGKPLGTYLLSSELATSDFVEGVKIGDVEWQMSLRFKRDYKPYAITLLDVRKDDYVGTDTPKNYSSDIKLVSKQLGADFERHLWMNNPLRFNGETIYQSGYHRDSAGREYTTLQIVRNTGWMMPYVACMLVAWGMAYQFGVTLTRFVGRQTEAAQTARRFDADAPSTEPSAYSPARLGRLLNWALPAVVVVIFAGYLAGKFMPPRPVAGEQNLIAFGELPIAGNGRVKPIDTLARDALKALSNNRQEFKTGVVKKVGPWEFPEKKSATQWLLEFIANPKQGAERRVVRIDNDELLSVLELPLDREDHLFAISEIFKSYDALQKLLEQVRKKSKGTLTAADHAAIELNEKIEVVDRLLKAFQPDFGVVRGGVPAIQAYKESYQVFKHGDMAKRIQSRNPPLAVFYEDRVFAQGEPKPQWETLAHAQLVEGLLQLAARQGESRHEVAAPVAAWTDILDAWEKKDAAGFNAAVSRYQTALQKDPPKDYNAKKVAFEAYFNHAAPFYYLIIPYVTAALLAACSWLGFTRPLNRTAFWLICLTFVLHTLALIGRIYISGRPPVTNLYSSAIFIGWAAVAFGIALERIFKLGFGNVMAGTIGFSTLLVAHNLSGDGSDTFSVLQAVLDTQFWLATHVVTVTLGYAATYVAGFLGLLYVILGLATPKLGEMIGQGNRRQTVGQALIRMIYGVLCFAILFSFVGTVLGGLWADDSWGRFWGWDPKENGALIIVLWNALVLHARWGGLVKDRGLAVLAVAGNVAVSWSWFGTNQLGVGLHSYGFTSGVVLALGLFVLSQLAVVVAGCLPKSLWLSNRANATTA